jgi:hypothetical protein
MRTSDPLKGLASVIPRLPDPIALFAFSLSQPVAHFEAHFESRVLLSVPQPFSEATMQARVSDNPLCQPRFDFATEQHQGQVLVTTVRCCSVSHVRLVRDGTAARAQLGKNPAGGTGVEFLGTPLQLRACFRNLFWLGHTGRNAICSCSGEFALLALAATITQTCAISTHPQESRTP